MALRKIIENRIAQLRKDEDTHREHNRTIYATQTLAIRRELEMLLQNEM